MAEIPFLLYMILETMKSVKNSLGLGESGKHPCSNCKNSLDVRAANGLPIKFIVFYKKLKKFIRTGQANTGINMGVMTV